MSFECLHMRVYICSTIVDRQSGQGQHAVVAGNLACEIQYDVYYSVNAVEPQMLVNVDVSLRKKICSKLSMQNQQLIQIANCVIM